MFHKLASAIDTFDHKEAVSSLKFSSLLTTND